MDYNINLRAGASAYYITDRAHILEVYKDAVCGPDFYNYTLYNKLGDRISGGSLYSGTNMHDNGMIGDLCEDLVEYLGEYTSVKSCIRENNISERSLYIAPYDGGYGEWSGVIEIKSQHISSEDYNKYFEPNLISEEDLNTLTEFGYGIDIYFLKDAYRNQIFDSVLNGKMCSVDGDKELPAWEARICCIDRNKEVSFCDLSEDKRKEILSCIANDENQGDFWTFDDIDIDLETDTLDALISEAEESAPSLPDNHSDKQRAGDAR